MEASWGLRTLRGTGFTVPRFPLLRVLWVTSGCHSDQKFRVLHTTQPSLPDQFGLPLASVLPMCLGWGWKEGVFLFLEVSIRSVQKKKLKSTDLGRDWELRLLEKKN